MNNQVIESTPIWPFVLVIVILTLFLAWFVWQYWMLKQNNALRKEKEPEDNKIVQRLKEQLKGNEIAFNKLNPVVQRYLTLREGMGDVAAKSTVREKLEALHTLMEQTIVWDKKDTEIDGQSLLGQIFNEAEILTEEAQEAMPTIKLIQRKIQQFYGLLRLVDLDEATERQIRSDFLELSMMMMDILESINNPNYIEALQGINVKLLKELITKDEAIGMTSPVTYLDIETSPWAQKLFKSIGKWAGTIQQPLIEQRPYLLNGMRFEFNNQ